MKRITEGSLSEIKNGTIQIENHLGQSGLENGAKVLIIQSRSGILRVIPLVDDIVAHVRLALELDAFTTASRKVYDKIKNSEVRLLHSTGFCPLEESCVWEGYFGISEKVKIESFMDWLSKLDMVIDTDVAYLKMNN